VGTGRSHTEQCQGSWEVVRVTECCVSPEICGDSPVGRGVVVVQDPVAGAPLLRAMSVRSVVEALQDSFVELLIYRLSCRDKLMINQPVNVEEHNQHGLDIGLHLPRFLWSRR